MHAFLSALFINLLFSLFLWVLDNTKSCLNRWLEFLFWGDNDFDFSYSLSSFRISKKYGKRVVFVLRFSIFILTCLYFCFVWISFSSSVILVFAGAFSFFGIFGVLDHPLALPSPSNSSSGSSQARWNEFDIGVLLESESEEGTSVRVSADEAGPSHPSQEEPATFTKNLSFETSLKRRIEAGQ